MQPPRHVRLTDLTQEKIQMNSIEKQAQHVGIGGYKCPCCGPTPKDRPQHRRTVRRRINAVTRDLAEEQMAAEDPSPVPAEERNHMILVFCEDADLRTRVTRVIEDLYFVEIVTTSDLAGAWSLQESFAFDLVIAVQDRPDGHAFDLLGDMRRAGSTVPVLGLSHSDATDDKLRFFGLGGDTFLSLPFTRSELQDRIQDLLGPLQD